MSYLTRVLGAEFLKVKRTLVLWSTLAASLGVDILYFFVLLMNRGAPVQGRTEWETLFQSTNAMWVVLALPLFITLMTALLAQMEHSEKQWKHWFALPVPRWSIYSAKWIIGLGLAWAGTILLELGAVGIGLSMKVLRPDLDFSTPIPWMALAKNTVLISLIVMLIYSLHTWIAERSHSFSFAVGVGMAAAIANILIMNSEKWSKVFPWALTLHVLNPESAYYLPQALAIGITGGLLVAFLGCWDVTRRDVL